VAKTIRAATDARQEPLWKAYVALAIGIVCIAWSAIFVKLAAVPGPVSAFYRVLFAALAMILWWCWKCPALPAKREALMAMLGGVFFALDLVLWNVALLITSATTATLLANNAPIWVGLGTLLIFRDRLPRHFWIGMIVALGGTAFILSSDLLQEFSIGYGDLLAIGASVFYAAYLLTTQHVRASLDTMRCMSLSVVTSSILLLILCLVSNLPLTGYRLQAWAALLGLGLIAQLGGWLAVNYALGQIRAAVTSVSLLGQPILTALFSMPLLDEHLSLPHIIGGILVLTGIYLVHRRM
jgi:drug/metabolite transporter (DMT)-like permease